MQIQKIYDGCPPNVVFTNREISLMPTIEEISNDSYHILCMRHIQSNVLSKLTPLCGTYIANAFSFSQGPWCKLVDSMTKDEYNQRLEDMKSKWSKQLSFLLVSDGILVKSDLLQIFQGLNYRQCIWEQIPLIVM